MGGRNRKIAAEFSNSKNSWNKFTDSQESRDLNHHYLAMICLFKSKEPRQEWRNGITGGE